MNLAPYRKAIVAVGNLTTSEAIGVVIVLLGAFGVYQVANAPK
jgi:hypothetical protein